MLLGGCLGFTHILCVGRVKWQTAGMSQEVSVPPSLCAGQKFIYCENTPRTIPRTEEAEPPYCPFSLYLFPWSGCSGEKANLLPASHGHGYMPSDPCSGHKVLVVLGGQARNLLLPMRILLQIQQNNLICFFCFNSKDHHHHQEVRIERGFFYPSPWGFVSFCASMNENSDAAEARGNLALIQAITPTSPGVCRASVPALVRLGGSHHYLISRPPWAMAVLRITFHLHKQHFSSLIKMQHNQQQLNSHQRGTRQNSLAHPSRRIKAGDDFHLFPY